MQITVMVEPAFQHSFWCRQTLEGIFAEAKRKKYALRFADGASYAQADYDALLSGGPRQLILVGTSVSWIPDVLRVLEKHQVRAILINYDSFARPSVHSVVRMDYVNAMQRLLGYFYHYGRERVALFGFNPNSSADCIKAQFFTAVLHARGDAEPQRHIFHNDGDLSACFNRFLSYAAAYDALICANDLVAVSALGQLQRAGIAVPEQLFLAGFGESILAQRSRPSITTATLDHAEMGRQAVMLCAYMQRQRAQVTASIRVESRLAVRESTQNLPDEAPPLTEPEGEGAASIDFYKDPQVQRLLDMEAFLFSLDSLDLDILTLLEKNVPLEAIAERCQSSTSTVGYRIRNMQTRAGVATRQALLERVAQALGRG